METQIHTWLDNFKHAWVTHDVEAVLLLFSEDVEYWETPYAKVGSFSLLSSEWQAIHTQTNIVLSMSLFQTSEDCHSVIWNLTYIDAHNINQAWAGTYLIRLDGSGKCIYFHQTGERKP